MIAALLFVALVVAIAVAVVVFVITRKRHAADLNILRQISYKNLSTVSDDEEKHTTS